MSDEHTTETRQEVTGWTPQDADKEIEKAYIRQRVRNAKAAENVQFIPADPKPSIKDTADKTVAVYARVSTKSTEQVSSIENQTKYYTEKVEKTPNWNMYRIYSDEGKSGTSTKRRVEFRQMIEDATKGHFDIILCASVSRFARNVSNCIEEVRRLKNYNPNHPVGVYFETENIYTLDPESSQALSVHAMLAEWESDNKSRRMILSYDQRICTGQYPVLDLLGYRHTTSGDLIIEKDEAKTVRYIFLAYLCGYSCDEIAETLTQKQRKTLKGRTEWNGSMVRSIMQNERRWGDLHARKTIVVDYADRKIIKNNRKRDAAYVPGHHEGIVTPEIAKAAKYIAESGVSLEGGVPDVSVIPSGTLKGFISIQPAWAGIDNPSLDSICRSVYTQEEAEQFDNAISKYDNSDKGYFIPSSSCFIRRTAPTITLSGNYLDLNRSLTNRFEHHDYYEILFHPFLKVIAIRSCKRNCSNAIYNDSLRLNAKGFMKVIFERMAWKKGYHYRLNAVTKDRGSDTIMFFSLDEPRIIKNGKILDTSSEEYPELNRMDKMKRDKLFNSITEKDISIDGVETLNPMIGDIPSKIEIMKELDSLLLSM